VLRTGCAWRPLPLDFPPCSTVHRWVLRLSQTGVFERLAHTPHRCASRPLGWRGEAGKRGDDPAWRVVGRKRHALMGMVGRPLMAAVSPADLHDSHGVIALRRASRGLFPFLACCFADRAYRGARVGVDTTITVEIVKPKTGQKGLAISPRPKFRSARSSNDRLRGGSDAGGCWDPGGPAAGRVRS